MLRPARSRPFKRKLIRPAANNEGPAPALPVRSPHGARSDVERPCSPGNGSMTRSAPR
jgi:hypothetical protein